MTGRRRLELEDEAEEALEYARAALANWAAGGKHPAAAAREAARKDQA